MDFLKIYRIFQNFKNIFIKIFLQEGFFYFRINKIMREGKFNDQSFENLNYYYLKLMYSLQKISQSLH